MAINEKWEKAKELYVEGIKGKDGQVKYLTLEEIADKVGLKPQTVRIKASRDNWKEQRKQFTSKVEDLRQSKKSEVLATEMVQFDQDCLRVARAGVALVAGAMRVIQNTQSADIKTALAAIKVARSTPGIDRLSAALANYQKVGKMALGDSGGDVLPGGEIEPGRPLVFSQTEIQQAIVVLVNAGAIKFDPRKPVSLDEVHTDQANP